MPCMHVPLAQLINRQRRLHTLPAPAVTPTTPTHDPHAFAHTVLIHPSLAPPPFPQRSVRGLGRRPRVGAHSSTMPDCEAIVAHVALARAMAGLAALEARRRVMRIGSLGAVTAPVPVLVAPEAAAATRRGSATEGAMPTSATAATATTTTAHPARTGVPITRRCRRPLHAIHGRRRRIMVRIPAGSGVTVRTRPIGRLRLRVGVAVLSRRRRLLLMTIRCAHAPLGARRSRGGRGRRRSSGSVRIMRTLAIARVRTVTCNVTTTTTAEAGAQMHIPHRIVVQIGRAHV